PARNARFERAAAVFLPRCEDTRRQVGAGVRMRPISPHRFGPKVIDSPQQQGAPMRTNRIYALVLALGIASSVSAHAQCLEWKAGFDFPGLNHSALAFAVYDDGMGP